MFLIFDLDGTLIDSRHDLSAAVNEMLASFALPSLPQEQIVSYVGHGIENLVRRSLEARAGGGRIDAAEALARFDASYAKHLLDRTILYPGVAETLEALRGTRKVILSNKAHRFIGAILEGLGVRRHFEAWYGGDSIPARGRSSLTANVMKPHPDSVRSILASSGAAAPETMIVGDGETDILAGKAAGIRTCAALYGFTAREKLLALNPDCAISEFSDFLGLVVEG